MPRTVIGAGPQVHAAGFGLPNRQCGDGHGQRNQEKQSRQHPKQDGSGTGMSRRRNPPGPHNGGNGEKR